MKISIITNAYSLKSSITAKDFELCKKYNPSALQIIDKDGNVKFSVNYVQNKPCVQNFGVTFSGVSKDNELAITELLPEGITGENAKEFVADKFGAIIPMLNQLEETVPFAAKKIAENKQSILDSISES